MAHKKGKTAGNGEREETLLEIIARFMQLTEQEQEAMRWIIWR